jgi:hypothetical protein
VIVSVTPREELRLTVLPATGLPLASNSVTVIVEVATPSAVTVAGLADTVEVVGDTAPAVKVTAAVWVMVMVSVVSVAVIVAVPAVVDAIVPLVWPFVSVAATGWVMVSTAPRSELSDTLFPLTGLPFASSSVTVIVDVSTPSAVRLVGFADTVEVVGDTAPAVKVTEAVWVMVMVSVVSVAVMVAVPAVVDAMVPVVCPFTSVTAAGWVIVS